jgi:hypothetical protein
MTTILFVRIKSRLDAEEIEKRARERLPRFQQVPGLVQKFYARDETTGDVCGIYFFKDRQSLVAYRDTELAKTIPDAYEAVDVRPEVYELMFPLFEGKSPL